MHHPQMPAVTFRDTSLVWFNTIEDTDQSSLVTTDSGIGHIILGCIWANSNSRHANFKRSPNHFGMTFNYRPHKFQRVHVIKHRGCPPSPESIKNSTGKVVKNAIERGQVEVLFQLLSHHCKTSSFPNISRFEVIQRNGDHFSAVMGSGVLNFPTGWIRVLVRVVYTKRQLQHRINTAMTPAILVSLKAMESNNVAPEWDLQPVLKWLCCVQWNHYC